MDTDKLNRWLTLTAKLAVLAGIVFLAAEINHADMMRTQINQSRAEASMNEAVAMYNPEYITNTATNTLHSLMAFLPSIQTRVATPPNVRTEPVPTAHPGH